MERGQVYAAGIPYDVIQIKTRAVKIVGIQVDPDGEWMKQIARLEQPIRTARGKKVTP